MMNNDELLRKLFEFDEADLFANRNGTLTPRQQARMAVEEKVWDIMDLIGGSILIIVAILPPIIIGIEAAPCFSNFCSDWPLSGRIFLTGMVLIWPLLWGYWGFRVIYKAFSTHRSPSLKKAEGPVNIIKVVDSQGEGEDYELHIGGKKFDCDSELADIMQQGDIYAIYYLKDTEEILSAEMLSKGK
jgi:hypothetical protein